MRPSPSSLSRVSRSKSSTSKLSQLTTLYHQTSQFLPTTTSTLPAYLNHAFAPIEPKPIETPSIPHLLRAKHSLALEANSTTNFATATRLEQGLTDEGYDVYPSGLGRGREGRVDLVSESWKLGSEPPLRHRIRRVTDALLGTSVNGKVGVASVLEGKEEARRAKASWEEDQLANIEASKVRAEEEARRREEQEREEREFAEQFREEGAERRL